MSKTDPFNQLSERVWVLDGATGTNLQSMGLDTGKSGELWVLEKPENILALHQKFIAAGSDIILTCTFNGNRFRLQHLGLEDKLEEINAKAVAIARQAVKGTEVLVAGSIGPSGLMMEPLGPLTADQAREEYARQAQILTDSGADLLVIETQYDLSEAKSAYQGVRSVSSLPLVLSFSYDRGLRTMMGVKPPQAVHEFENLDIQAFGINCGRSLEENVQVLAALHSLTQKPVWFKPNAGLPSLDTAGKTSYNITPEQMGNHAATWINTGARFVGGCCGTSPSHLAAIAQAVHTR